MAKGQQALQALEFQLLGGAAQPPTSQKNLLLASRPPAIASPSPLAAQNGLLPLESEAEILYLEKFFL